MYFLGLIFYWGNGEFSKYGSTGADDPILPKLVDSLQDQHIVHVACGDNTSYAVTKTGVVYSW